MNVKLFVLPSLCLGGAGLLLAPPRPGAAFSKSGGSLDATQRDVRVFNNFADAVANNNTTPDAQFPGRLGAELAIWKGIVEWGSRLHGDGSGDPLGGNLLGSGGANFDGFWAGSADGVGGVNDNVVSALSDCGGSGLLAFTEMPITDGWRNRFCDEWTWSDGPGTAGANRWDIQAVMCRQYGLSLGLGSSTDNTATMYPTISDGQTSSRSIEADDVAGLQCIYGVASLTKPVITATEVSGGSITIHGSSFALSGAEVWFTPVAVTAAAVADPVVKVTGVSSDGCRLTIAIPAEAGPGDVIVKNPGSTGSSLSNAFPTDLSGSFGPVGPRITGVSPSAVEALIPGTTQTVTLLGCDFLLATSVLLDGEPIASARYTIVDDTEITLDMPQAAGLGSRELSVTDGVDTSAFPISIVPPATPVLELGNGEALNAIDRNDGLDVLVAGPVGSRVVFRASSAGYPTLERYLNLDPADAAAPLINGHGFVIPAEGWASLHVPALPDPGPAGMDWFGLAFRTDAGRPFATSNQQSIHLVQ